MARANGDEVSLEWLSARIAIMRYHPNADGYGGDFDLVCVLERIGGHGFLRGLLCRGRYTAEMRRAIAQILYSEGIWIATFERRHGRQRTVTLTR